MIVKCLKVQTCADSRRLTRGSILHVHKAQHKYLLLSDFLGDLDLISILQSTAIFRDTDSFFHKCFLSKERLQATHISTILGSIGSVHTHTHTLLSYSVSRHTALRLRNLFD